ncbi:acVLRF1 family peptidyl-tRNA hydrolase [Nocardioides caldifontis]|uniref:acVLRF1 family peptidyl-tRNA hydrolase n=1 Tax=Nocardioides caldifontis TaxID=2588938 RepID=UPI001396897C|nr:acVLRF1 family peptidyl-tRNA hydrolase [Nocardioides caldifontis]
MAEGRERLLLPASRVERWFENFESRHGGAAYDTVGGGLRALAADGSTAVARLPFDQEYGGVPLPSALVGAVTAPERWGVLLVRKGGFAVARLTGGTLQEHKVGQRHVQGRTKAGGQSQQRFARRRDNQARAAYEAAADHAARVLGARLDALVVGGDRGAVDAVLDDPRLAGVAGARTSRWLPVADPRRSVLDAAVADACAVAVEVVNAA